MPQLAAVPGVASVDGSLTEMVSLGESHLIGIPLRGLDSRGFAIASCRLPRAACLQADEQDGVLLGSGIAEALKKRPGNRSRSKASSFGLSGSSRRPIRSMRIASLRRWAMFRS